jgi:hypothetical protein
MGPLGRHKWPRRNSLEHPPTKSVASAKPRSFQEDHPLSTLQKAPPSSTLQTAGFRVYSRRALRLLGGSVIPIMTGATNKDKKTTAKILQKVKSTWFGQRR